VAETIRPFTQSLRLIARQRTDAEQTAAALAALPKHTQRELTVVTVRCAGNELVLRVLRIPKHLPGIRYDRHLVIPTSAITYRYGDQRVTVRAGFLAELDSFDVQCRCHPRPVTLTPAHLRGETSPPAGTRIQGVLQSEEANSRPVGYCAVAPPASPGDRRRAPELDGCPAMPRPPVLTPAARRLKAKRAGLTRHRGADHPDTVAVERDYRAEVLAEHVRTAAPSLTPRQRDRIAALLRAPASDREATVA
jgi:hypothetical protein